MSGSGQRSKSENTKTKTREKEKENESESERESRLTTFRLKRLNVSGPLVQPFGAITGKQVGIRRDPKVQPPKCSDRIKLSLTRAERPSRVEMATSQGLVRHGTTQHFFRALFLI